MYKAILAISMGRSRNFLSKRARMKQAGMVGPVRGDFMKPPRREFRATKITLWWTNIALENHHFLWENPL